MYTPDEIRKAKKRVKSKKEFYQHLVTYVIINSFLIALNLIVSHDTIWFHYSLLGWGIGLMFHYVDVFGVPGFDILSSDWEERELEKELKMIDSRILQRPDQDKKEIEKRKKTEKNYDDSEIV